MATSNVCWGIEVGAHAIKALKLEATGEGKCKVVDWAFVPHPKVLSTPGVDPNDVLRVSLGALTNQVDLSKAAIAVSIPGHSSFARFAKLPPVEPKNVANVVKFEAQQQIPFPLEEVEWDYQTFVTPDSPEVEVGIFAVTKERINERLQLLEDVGITPNYVVLSPIAVYNALAFDLEFRGDKMPGTIIVDIGTTSTDLVVATPGRMWVRTFPLGGHNFTEALVNQFQLSYAKAEKLKRDAQDTKHARQVFQAMRPVFTDLAQDIQRSIGYFQSINTGTELTRVIGVGATWRLPGLRKYLKQQLGLDVYRIDNFKKIGKGTNVSGEDSEDGGEQQQAADPNDRGQQFDLLSLEMATAYGLALQGLGLNSVGGNLMPVTNVRRQMWRDKAKWFGVAAGVAVAASGVMFVNPVRAHFAVAGAQKDPSIQRAVSMAEDLKRQANEAGVASAGEPDMRAANIQQLLERREVFRYVVSDLQAMLASAEQRRQTWGATIAAPGQPPVAVPDGPAFDLQFVKTSYVPPVDPASGGGSPLPEALRDAPAVEVQAQFRTGMPEPRRFINETLNRWLRDNRTRTGLPYQIVYLGAEGGDITVRIVETEADANVAMEIVGGPAQTPGMQGGIVGQADPRDRDARRGGGAAPAGGRGGGRGGVAEASGAVVLGEGSRSLGVNATDPDTLAPLTFVGAERKPTALSVVRFYVVLKAPATPGQEDQAAAGGAQ